MKPTIILKHEISIGFYCSTVPKRQSECDTPQKVAASPHMLLWMRPDPTWTNLCRCSITVLHQSLLTFTDIFPVRYLLKKKSCTMNKMAEEACKSSAAKLQWAQIRWWLNPKEISRRNNERQKTKRKEMIASGLLPSRPKGRPWKSLEERLKRPRLQAGLLWTVL